MLQFVQRFKSSRMEMTPAQITRSHMHLTICSPMIHKRMLTAMQRLNISAPLLVSLPVAAKMLCISNIA